jgi:diacylglycerol O-acyltransferase / wax synthase
MQQFNTLDAGLLFFETTHTPFHVSMVNIYDPSTCPGDPPTFEDIVEAVRVSLPAAPPFRRKILRVPLDLDYPYWVEDKYFDLEFHMRHLALPRPGNWTQFRSQVSRLMSRPLDLKRPPWEMTVIEGLDNIEGLSPGSFATVLKIHHCAIDGQTGVALVNALHQDSPDKVPPVLKDVWQAEEIVTSRQLVRKAWVNSILRPAAIARLVLSNARSLVQAGLAELRSADDGDEGLSAPETILNGPISAHRTFDIAICTLDDLKRVRRSVEGATVNDVCLTIVAEGMRRYLQAKKALPKASLITTVPISTRTPAEVRGGGNQIAITRVSLHTDISDPIKRLAAINQDTRAMKTMQDGVVMSVLLDAVHNLPGALVGAAAKAIPLLSANANTFCNTMVTNVPGPMEPIYFLGARVVRMFGSPPLMDGGGVFHSVGSYAGEFMFTFTACRDRIPDPDFYRDCLDEAAQAVIAAADKKQAPAKKKAARKPRRKA